MLRVINAQQHNDLTQRGTGPALEMANETPGDGVGKNGPVRQQSVELAAEATIAPHEHVPLRAPDAVITSSAHDLARS